LYQRILVPLDGSPEAETALDVTSGLRYPESEFLLVRMQGLGAELGYPVGFPVPTEALEAERLRCDAYLLALAGRLSTQGGTVRRIVLPHQEDVAQAIAQLAKAEKSQVVVMTSHGWEGLGRALRGSVAEELARIASCPVLIIGPQTEVLQDSKSARRAT